jgi:hypothetical protein
MSHARSWRDTCVSTGRWSCWEIANVKSWLHDQLGRRIVAEFKRKCQPSLRPLANMSTRSVPRWDCIRGNLLRFWVFGVQPSEAGKPIITNPRAGLVNGPSPGLTSILGYRSNKPNSWLFFNACWEADCLDRRLLIICDDFNRDGGMAAVKPLIDRAADRDVSDHIRRKPDFQLFVLECGDNKITRGADRAAMHKT